MNLRTIAFSSHPFVEYCRRLVWVSLMCVCGRGREGEFETSRRMSFLRSLHFGIKTGSGLSRGNMTSSPSTLSLLPPSILLLFLVFPLPPFVCPSPQSVPTHSRRHSCLFWFQISRKLSHVCAACDF